MRKEMTFEALNNSFLMFQVVHLMPPGDESVLEPTLVCFKNPLAEDPAATTRMHQLVPFALSFNFVL
jgi:hypothetical protein